MIYKNYHLKGQKEKKHEENILLCASVCVCICNVCTYVHIFIQYTHTHIVYVHTHIDTHKNIGQRDKSEKFRCS